MTTVPRTAYSASVADARRWVLIASVLGSSMVFTDATAVNVILPVLQRDLGASAAQVQWVVESYALFLAALLLVGGALGDRYGRRNVFVAGVAVFAVASAACAFAPSPAVLIAARGLQGVGGALLTPGSLALITGAFDAAGRGKAIGSWSAFSALTSAGGPVLGGWLAEHVSWRAIFLLNAPLAAAVVVVCLLRVPEMVPDGAPPGLDPAGAVLAVLGLGALTFGLIQAPGQGVRDPLVSAALVGGAASLAAFVIVERRVRSPMLPVELFRSKTFSGANVLTLLLYAALSGFMFFLPFDLIDARGYTPTEAGAALLPFVAVMFFGSPRAGALADRTGPRVPLVLGPAITAVGFAVLALEAPVRSYARGVLPGLLLLSAGMTLTVAPLTSTVMGSVPLERAGLASGINNAVTRAAGLLAVAVLGSAAFSYGFRVCLIACATLAAAAALTAFLSIERSPDSRTP